MAVGYMNWNNQTQSPCAIDDQDAEFVIQEVSNPNFMYDVGSRYWATISKQDLYNAKSVLDIVPEVAEAWWTVKFETVKIAVLQGPFEISETGSEKTLNSAQKELLQSVDYGSNFYIKALDTEIHPETGEIEYYTYYISVIPEKEAKYEGGQDDLINYIRTSTSEHLSIVEDEKLKGGRMHFTVTKNGNISNTKLDSSCGYSEIDETMIELMNNLPGKWEPATNSNGEEIDQDLVFTFGMVGC